jgi:hypothetical protein
MKPALGIGDTPVNLYRAALAAAIASSLCGCGRLAGAGEPSLETTSARHAPSTPAPQPLTADPLVLSLTAAGSIETFTVAESGYAGTFVAKAPKSCKKIVRLQPKSLPGPNATFTVRALKAGRCNLRVQDKSGQAVVVTVFVTTTGGTIN